MNHSLDTVDVFTKFHGNPSNSFCDIPTFCHRKPYEHDEDDDEDDIIYEGLSKPPKVTQPESSLLAERRERRSDQWSNHLVTTVREEAKETG